MKTPTALEREMTSDDIQIVEQLEQLVENFFAAHPAREAYSLHKGSLRDQSVHRRHFAEFRSRLAAAGWEVEEDDLNLRVWFPRDPGPIALARFEKGRPASNIRLLREMIGKDRIDAILDPYVDDRALDLLVSLHRSFDVRFAEGLRILGRKKQSTLTAAFSRAALTEIGAAQGELRIAKGDGHENRLIFFENRTVLSLGASLNALNVNERPHRDADRGARADFDNEWATATIISP
jgi:hypothetical protein